MSLSGGEDSLSDGNDPRKEQSKTVGGNIVPDDKKSPKSQSSNKNLSEGKPDPQTADKLQGPSSKTPDILSPSKTEPLARSLSLDVGSLSDEESSSTMTFDSEGMPRQKTQ